jgi:Family of unknown function (DUF5372)
VELVKRRAETEGNPVQRRTTLRLRDPDLGSFTMPREWTDWARPGAQASATRVPLLIDAFGLATLAELIAALAHGQFGVDR